MGRLTRTEENRHARAMHLVAAERALTRDERGMIRDDYRAGSSTRSREDGAFFTPEGLAVDLSIEVDGVRIIDLGAGIGRLAFHNRDEWAENQGRGPEFVCLEQNEDYVAVGQRVMPQATWICADVFTIPEMLDELGQFDVAIANPPFGVLRGEVPAASGYRGRQLPYHVIALAAMIAKRGVFIVPQTLAPFRYSGRPRMELHGGNAEYRRFRRETGSELEPNCGIDTTCYSRDWDGAAPLVEIVRADLSNCTLRRTAGGLQVGAEEQGQLALPDFK